MKMTDIDKINEELRNYKLFKIQRINTREQEFRELKNDLDKNRRDELLIYVLSTINVISIVFFLYSIFKICENKAYFNQNKELIIINFVLIITLSIYFTLRSIKLSNSLKKHTKTAENAIQYFSNESEKLKVVYENYVDNYLEKQNCK